jgi:NAD(P)-dependent dehydrogenase (short-subunit alcohol dehydrogenase family)
MYHKDYAITMSTGWNLSGGGFTATSHSTTYDYISPLRLNLAGKHVLITGAAWENGIGFATAMAFARAGASAIAIADLHGVADDLAEKVKLAASEAGRLKPLVLNCTVDITKQESVEALYDSVLQGFDGRLDILINNAAYMEPYKLFLDADPDLYWRTWEVNIRGLFNMARAFLPLQLQTYASNASLCTMINVASSGALTARTESSSYRTSKLAILRWTESLQLEYGDQGLLAYCVNPGAIQTKITENLPEQARTKLPHRPDIAGDTIAWLAAERKEWLGGRYVSCPWDMEEFMNMKDDIVQKDMLKMRMAF